MKLFYSNPKHSTASIRDIMMQIHKEQIAADTKQIAMLLFRAAVLIGIILFICAVWSVLGN